MPNSYKSSFFHFPYPCLQSIEMSFDYITKIYPRTHFSSVVTKQLYPNFHRDLFQLLLWPFKMISMYLYTFVYNRVTFFRFFFAVLRLKPRALYMLGKYSIIELHPKSNAVKRKFLNDKIFLF
jgi:hypothetical protein